VTLVKKPPTVQIPPALYERVAAFEGGKYTPRSVIVTAIEEWLDAKAREAAAREAAEAAREPRSEGGVS
jgi:hypothetical protein